MRYLLYSICFMRKKVLDLSFVECAFSEAFTVWLSYKEEIKDYYKTQRGVELAYKKLKKLSNSNPDRAMRIVEESIERGWKGLFPLKDERNSFSRREKDGASIFDTADYVLQADKPGGIFN